MNSDETDDLTQKDRLTALDRCSHVHRPDSQNTVANLDSLNYILRFVYGSENNIGYVSGAFKTLGLGKELTRSIALNICQSVVAGQSQESALKSVLEGTGVRCEKIQDFPSRSKLSPEKQAAASATSLAKMQADAEVQRQKATATQELDRKVAQILGVDLEPIDGEWGWQRSGTGSRFEPTSDGAVAFGLISQLRLNIQHLPRDPVRGYTDIAVSHSDARTGDPTLTLHSKDFSYSLPRTLCEVAVMVTSRR